MNNELNFRSALKETLPTVLGYIGIATTVGIIGKTSGLSIMEVVLTSLIIYAGSAQLIAINLIAAANPFYTIVLAVFLVNSRIILMSTTIAKYFHKESLLKNIIIGSLLTDESFALGISKLNYTQGKLNFEWFNTVNLISYITWIISTALGALLGQFISNPQKFGLDFSIVAMFLGLLYLQVISDKSLKKSLQYIIIFLTMCLTYGSLIILPSNLVIITVTLIGCSLGVLLKHAIQ